MNYILSNINRRISFLEASGDKLGLKVQLQAKFEFYLILMLGYLWNNISNIEEEDRSYIGASILKPSIGSIVSILRSLDINKSIFGNRKYKVIQEQLNKYPQLRNEKVGHGYSYEDDVESYIDIFKNFNTLIEEQDYPLFTGHKNDLIYVKEIINNHYQGISYKPEGFDYTPWRCSKEVGEFEIDSLYICEADMSYTKLSPFIFIEDENSFYIYSNLQEKLTGRSKFNRLVKTGIIYKEIPSFRNIEVLNDGIKKRTLNGTVINNFSGSGLISLISKEKLIDKQTDCCVVNHD